MAKHKRQQPYMLVINDRYGTFIWGMANRYHTGMWDPEDVYQQLLMMAYSAVCDGTLSMGESEWEIGLVKSFLISRAINIIRYEVRRQGAELMKSNKGGIWGTHKVNRRPADYRFDISDYIVEVGDKIDAEPISSDQPEAVRFEQELIKELLFTRLDHQTATFIYELAFPSQATIDIATNEQAKARKDSRLRMNIHDLKVLPSHVAKALVTALGRILPKVTISRTRARAKKELYPNGPRRPLDV